MESLRNRSMTSTALTNPPNPVSPRTERFMSSSRVFRYRDPAAAILGLRELRRQGLTSQGVLFLALDPRGEAHIAVSEQFDAVSRLGVGDKMTLEAPWKGRYFHFDSIHRLPGDSVMWNGDRRLDDTGSATELAWAIGEWLRGDGVKSLFLGCTSHQPGSWWAAGPRASAVELHLAGYADTVITTSGLLARRVDEPTLYHLDFQTLAQRGPQTGWTPVFDSALGNILLVERRVFHYRLVLSCQGGLIEIDVSGLPDRVTETARVALRSGFGVVGRLDSGAFAVTAGTVEPWGLADVSAPMLVGSPNQSLLDRPRTLRAMELDAE
jgi:hypothetical protein